MVVQPKRKEKGRLIYYVFDLLVLDADPLKWPWESAHEDEIVCAYD